MKTNRNHTQKMAALILVAGALTTVYAQPVNDITAISPNSAFQGAMAQTLTFTLATGNPPAPKAGVIPQSVSIGSIQGSALAHPSQYTVTAVFDIPANEVPGSKEAVISFRTPTGNTLTFSMADGFTVLEAGDVAPVITEQPQSQTVATGSSATFSVAAWGTEPLTYQWYKDEAVIAEANTSSYTIASVGSSDQGNYDCLISNDFGSVMSEAASLTLTTTPAFEGYNLFAPMKSTETLLMDNSGQTVHSWSSSYNPALSAYLLEDGTLLRTANTRSDSFEGGGIGGRVEHYSWDGELLWSFDYSNTEYCLHHDVEKLPNGNILMIAWQRKTESEALAAGRDPSLLLDGELWPDHIIEVQPDGTYGGTIVWEWHAWDHLIQDYDAGKDNYGIVADHPEKINLNYVQGRAVADWHHINGIDYHVELDQIVLSVHNFSEIWIIDHSTTTAEAASSTGGNSGQGGDLLYRWGNPQTYDRGSEADQQFFVQHDAEWIAGGLPGAGDILIFNNGQGRADGDYSSVDQISPPVTTDGSYILDVDVAYGPAAPTWTYTSVPVTDFYAERISGAQRLANGNTLICAGTTGRLFEVTSDGAMVWDYNHDGEIFRVDRFSPDYPGFVGTDLEPVVTYPIVDTGQVTCYDESVVITAPAPGTDFYGQDAQHPGHQPSYTLSDDGLTVTDNVTDLTWTQSPDLDRDGDIDAQDKLTQAEAASYPETLNTQQYGGYDDWRLPTMKEIYSLMNFSGTDPSGLQSAANAIPFIDTDTFAFGYGDTSAGEREIDAQFATTTLYVSTTMGGNETMFGLNLADGRIKGYPIRNKTFYVYFVRGHTDYGINRFTDNSDGTISDSATGLMWSQEDSDVGMNWQEALAWVQAQNAAAYLGFSDWRLPNVKALHSLVDYTRSPDTTDSPAIDAIFYTTTITNEAGQTDYPCFWSSTTHASGSANSNAGRSSAYICFGRAMGYWNNNWVDVHGAGCQRSDPKTGDPNDWPTGHGPQGDAIRIYNYVRLVRDNQ
ncbi:DUF1566 domain-containing protein [Planctomycetota bacterium]